MNSDLAYLKFWYYLYPIYFEKGFEAAYDLRSKQWPNDKKKLKIKGYFHFCLGRNHCYGAEPPPKTIRKLYSIMIPERRQADEVSPIITQVFCLRQFLDCSIGKGNQKDPKSLTELKRQVWRLRRPKMSIIYRAEW